MLREVRSWGRLRACLLLWLLSSSEAISVYGPLSLAAAGSSSGNTNSYTNGKGRGANPKLGSAARAIGALKALLWAPVAAVAAARSKGCGRDESGTETCRIDSGSSGMAVATGCRGGHVHVSGGGAGGIPGAGGRALDAVKLASMVALTGLNVLCWLVPLRVKRFTESKKAISLANAFSGGVFLSLAFGHMLPHACHGFRDLGYAESVPYFLTLGGYMLIFFVEKIAFDAHGIMHSGEDDAHSHGHRHTPVPGKIGGAAAAAAKGVPVVAASNGGSIIAAPAAASGHGSGRSAIILLAALSVHSVFETMALGLADSKLDVALLGGSIALHTPAEAIALLVSFLRSGLSEKSILLYLGLFSCVAPIGVILGMFVNEFAGKLVDATLVALTAGTFFYVGATEVVAEEFESSDNRWLKFFALLVGMGGIAVITTWAEMLEGGHG